jgi:uncharacterized protein (TIGR03435 family)
MWRALASLLAAVLVAQALGSDEVRAQAPGPRFDVASLKERDRNVPVGIVGMQTTPGRLTNRCVTLRSFLYYAYLRTSSTPVEGLPSWSNPPCSSLDTADTYEFQATMPVGTTDEDVRLMLQAFLAERFKLAVHWETRKLPIFTLVVASGGFKLKPSDPKDDPPRKPGSLGCPADDRGCHIIAMGSATMPKIADAVAFNVGRPVVDRTGLPGTYYFDVKYAGENAPDSPLPSLVGALKEQFGLELKAETGPVEVLVIDRAEKPTPN